MAQALLEKFHEHKFDNEDKRKRFFEGSKKQAELIAKEIYLFFNTRRQDNIVLIKNAKAEQKKNNIKEIKGVPIEKLNRVYENDEVRYQKMTDSAKRFLKEVESYTYEQGKDGVKIKEKYVSHLPKRLQKLLDKEEEKITKQDIEIGLNWAKDKGLTK